jgi:glycosyltransferase involved in cell wall biosynthesis
MKVLHIITRMNTGGPAVFLDHLTNAMSELGVKSTIAYGFCESNEADYTETHKLSADLLKIGSMHRSLNPFHDLKSFFKIRKIIKEVRPDLVNTHTSKAGVLGRIAAKSVNTKLPVVHTFHGHLIYGYFARYKTFIFTLIERFLSRFTNAAVSITGETQNSLQKLKIGRSIKWQVIHLGIPIKKVTFSPEIASEKIKLLWVGRFTDIKDPLYAVEVIRNLEEISSNKFELTMIGGGELLEQVELRSAALPIKFTGWLNKPFENSPDFDLLILTSKNEGMGLVILEAANFSKATVARKVGGVGEFIVNNFNGLLVDGVAKNMAEEISNLNKVKISQLGENAHKTLLDGFTDKVMAKNYYTLYKSLI